MSKIETFACDVCGVHKKDANHWFRAYKLLQAEGVIVIGWDGVTTADAVDDEAHLCGAECVSQWVSRNLLT